MTLNQPIKTNNKIKVVRLMDAQIKVLESVVERIDTSIEKLTEVSNSIGKLLAVHDERINQLEKIHTRQEDDIKDIYSKIGVTSKEICKKLDEVEDSLEAKMKEHSITSENLHKELKTDLDTKLKTIDDRIGILERWRWIVIGAAAIIGFIIDKFVGFII